MRIVVDYRPALRQRSGVGEYIHQLIGALAAGPGRRDEIVLFSSSLRHQVNEAVIAGLEVANRRVPVRLLNRLWHRLGWPPVEWLTGRSYDVVHSPAPVLLPSNGAAGLITIHDLDFLAHPERTRAEMRYAYPALVARHAAAADGIIAVSEHVAEKASRLLRIDPERISVCPHGVPRWAPAPRTEPGNPTGGYVLFLGTLEPRKNVEGLLAAYRDLIARRPDTPPLTLAGAAVADATAWREAIARPPLFGRVNYHGYVRDVDRQAVYAGARLLVLPSFDEGFGMPVVEAMSLGIPVVASTRGALPEVSGGAALLVDPEDVAGLAQAMERVLFDAGLARRMGEDGLRRAQGYSWARTAELTRAAYERAIEARRTRLGG